MKTMRCALIIAIFSAVLCSSALAVKFKRVLIDADAANGFGITALSELEQPQPFPAFHIRAPRTQSGFSTFASRLESGAHASGAIRPPIAYMSPADLTAKAIVDNVGGVIFVEIARPDPSLSGQCPALTYDAAANYGHRLFARFPKGGSAAIEAADWEIVPDAHFVNSDDDAVTSLERDGSRADTQSVDVQAAFVNRLSGIVFLLSDIIYTPLTDPIGISSLYDNYEIPGFNRMLSGKPYDGYSRDSARIVKNSIRDKVLAGNQFYFTDWGRQFSFSIEGGRLSMKGFPYYLPIMKNNGTATPLWDHAYPKDLSEASYLYNVSPVIYRSAFRQVKLIQFFRYVKSNCGSQWTAFLDQMDKNNDIEDIEVPMPTEIRY